jgi:putative ABC transport system permease protein
MLLELHMAWRESCAALNRSIFVLLSTALGVAALAAITGFRQSFESALARSARELIAADLAVRLTTSPSADELRTLERPSELGAQMTWVVETYSMAAWREHPVFTTIKAVDPGVYPFYGQVTLDSHQALREILDDSTTVVNREFLSAMNLSPGDSVQLGAARFRIAGIIENEPDRLSYGIELGPRAMITQKGLASSQIESFGFRAARSYLYRLPEKGLDLDQLRAILDGGLQRAMRISDYRDPSPALAVAFSRTMQYLTLVAFLSVLLGAIGVGANVEAHLSDKMDSIAILKSLGARSGQMIRIHLYQVLGPVLVGSFLGVGGGFLVARAGAPLLRNILDVRLQVAFSLSVALPCLLVGMASALLFSAPSLLAVRRIRPMRLLQRRMPETAQTTLQFVGNDRLAIAVSSLLVFTLVFLAGWVGQSWRLALACLAGLSVALLILGAAGKVLLWSLKFLQATRFLALRHALRSLRRPTARFGRVFAALSLGAAALMFTYFVEQTLLRQVEHQVPADFPNFFLAGIGEGDKDALFAMLSRQPGVEVPGRPIPEVPARLERADGRGADDPAFDFRLLRYFQNQSLITWADAIPSYTRLTTGAWWQSRGPSRISVSAPAAQELGLRLGSRLEFVASGTKVSGEVASIREIEFLGPDNFNDFIFSPGALDGLPAFYVGTLRAAPGVFSDLESLIFRSYPKVLSFDLRQAVSKAQELVDAATRVIRIIAGFAILSGIGILAWSISATKFERSHEAALLRIAGATRGQVWAIQAAEFLIIGLAAGAVGGVLATAAADWLLWQMLHVHFTLQWDSLLAAAAGTAVLALLVGWIGVYGAVRAKPLEVLREE